MGNCYREENGSLVYTFDSECGGQTHSGWQYFEMILLLFGQKEEEKLREFIDYFNNPTIKSTCKWSKNEIKFQDVKVLNESGVLETDVFIKPTDSHQYLHYGSWFPGAQAMQVRRIFWKSCFF